MLKEILYIAVTINQRIVRSLPKTVDREEALGYLMKCQAGAVKWMEKVME